MPHLTISAPGIPHTEAAGYKRLGAHLQLPLTPHSYDNDFEHMANSEDDDLLSACSTVRAQPWTPHEWDQKCHPSSGLKSVFEDWDDDEVPAFEISIDEDGAQVLHIPCESLFFDPPTPPRPFNHPLCSEWHSKSPSPHSVSFPRSPISTHPLTLDAPAFEIRPSKKDGPTYCAQGQCRKTSISSPSSPNEIDARTPENAILFLDTSFLNNMTTNMTLSALSASWYSPASGAPGASALASKWGQREEADVPCSALSPTDAFCEMHFGSMRSETPSLTS